MRFSSPAAKTVAVWCSAGRCWCGCDRLESEILAARVSGEDRRWLASCGLTVERMQNQMDPVYTPAQKFTCTTATIAACRWPLSVRKGQQRGTQNLDEWGNQLNEENPHQLQQLIRLPGQQYDKRGVRPVL